MKTKHTPGPWKWIGSRQSPKERIYLSTPDGYANWTDLHSAEAAANARLIAAAPDLLAALQSIVSNPDMADGEEPRRLIAEARAAIAKAKGN